MTQRVHVCLVSGETLANLIPVLMYKPDVVHLVVSDDMVEKAINLKNILVKYGIECEKHGSAPATDLLKVIQKYADEQVVPKLNKFQDVNITLNYTGGTKPMSLGFFRSFQEHFPKAEVIYTDTRHHKILLENNNVYENMKDVLDLETYLMAQGFTPKIEMIKSRNTDWVNLAKSRSELTYWLAENAGKLDGFIGTLNYLINNSIKKENEVEILVNPSQKFRTIPERLWKNALQLIRKYGLIKWKEGEREVIFVDIEPARYLSGFWLEEYTWLELCKLNLPPEKLGAGIKGNWKNGVENEFDAMLVHRNQLMIIESKTLRFGNDSDKDQDIVHKLDSLGRSTGGLFGKVVLLSARKLDDNSMRRAKGQKITVIHGNQLPQLLDKVTAWMEGRHF